MRLSISKLIVGLGISLSLGGLPAYAQISDPQVAALVEALRQAAPQTGQENDGLYSDWQILPNNIPRWSESCIGRELSPAEFESDVATAREVVTCVMRDVLQEEYAASNGDETIAVRRAAAWWMTGDPGQYNSANTADYTQRVLSFYQQQVPSAVAPDTTNPPAPTAAPSEPASTISPNPVYDRYMNAGYAATDQGDYDTALLYFRRALDERPGDSYAQQAITNVEGYRSQDNEDTSSSDSNE